MSADKVHAKGQTLPSRTEACSRLFAQKIGEDSLYTHLRESKYKQDIRDYIVDLYLKSWEWGGVDEHFHDDFHKNLVQRYWELLVGSWLVDNFPGKVLSQSQGPDYVVCGPTGKTYIECIAPRNGVGLPNIREPRRGGWINRDAPVLRFTGAVKEKAEKIQDYIAKGYVSKGDPIIVAVNLSEIPDIDIQENSGIPMLLRGLMGIGDYVMKIPVFDQGQQFLPEEARIPRVEPSYVDKQNTANGGVVDLEKFLKADYEHISAVVTSYDRYVDMPRDCQRFFMLHNPNAIHQLPKGMFGCLKSEYYCKEGMIHCFAAAAPAAPAAAAAAKK